MGRWFAIPVCLMIGVVVNLAVAWWLNASPKGYWAEAFVDDATAIERGWPIEITGARTSFRMWKEMCCIGHRELLAVAGEMPKDQALYIEESGWPCLAIRSSRL